MRFGLIGYGLWGRLHAEAIRKAPDATLVAVAGASQGGGVAIAAAHLAERPVALLSDGELVAVHEDHGSLPPAALIPPPRARRVAGEGRGRGGGSPRDPRGSREAGPRSGRTHHP